MFGFPATAELHKLFPYINNWSEVISDDMLAGPDGAESKVLQSGWSALARVLDSKKHDLFARHDSLPSVEAAVSCYCSSTKIYASN